MRLALYLYYTFISFVVPMLGVVLVTLAPTEKNYLKQICTMFCHDRDCYHDSHLPAFLSSNEGLYGHTIEALLYTGDLISSFVGVHEFTGYGIMNLFIFCFSVPTLHFFFMFASFKLARRAK